MCLKMKILIHFIKEKNYNIFDCVNFFFSLRYNIKYNSLKYKIIHNNNISMKNIEEKQIDI